MADYRGKTFETPLYTREERMEKRVILDGVSKGIQNVIRDSYREMRCRMSTFTNASDEFFYFSKLLGKRMPYLGSENYEVFTDKPEKEMVRLFIEKASEPMRLSEISELNLLECASQGYAILLTLSDTTWKAYLRNDKNVDPYHVALGKKIGSRVAIIDPIVGAISTNAQSSNFLQSQRQFARNYTLLKPIN